MHRTDPADCAEFGRKQQFLAGGHNGIRAGANSPKDFLQETGGGTVSVNDKKIRTTVKKRLTSRDSCITRACMPSINITVSVEAHERLSALKKPGQSFSDVILENVERPPYETAGELLDSFKEEPVPYKADPTVLTELKKGRGRRSPRPALYGR
jgi:predicted CopG family antitoxin